MEEGIFELLLIDMRGPSKMRRTSLHNWAMNQNHRNSVEYFTAFGMAIQNKASPYHTTKQTN